MMKRIKIIALGLILALSLLGKELLLANEGSSIEDRYQAGEKYFHSGDYEAAIKEFEEVVRIDPNYEIADDYLWVAKDRLLAKTKKALAIQERKKRFEKIAKKKEERKVERGSNFAREKGSWRKWLANEREKKRIQKEKKKELARLKKEKAVDHYYGIDALEKISQNAQGMIATAEKKKVLQEKREEEKWAEIENLPSPQKEKAMAMIYMTRANVAYGNGNYDEALKEWEKAGALDPTNPAPKQCIERLRQMIEDNKKTQLETARQKSIDQTKEAVKKYCRRGEYLYRDKDYKGSIEEFQKALAINPNSKVAQAGILEVKKAIKKENIKEEKKRQKRSQQVSKLVSKGNKYFRENKFVKAKQFALKALKLDSNSTPALELLKKAKGRLE